MRTCSHHSLRYAVKTDYCCCLQLCSSAHFLALSTLSHALHAAEEDRRRIGLDRQPRGRGVLKTVATMPFNLVRGGVALVAGGNGGDGGGALSPRTPVSPAGDGLADQWIDFLIEQAQRDGASAATGGTSSAAAPDERHASAAYASGSNNISAEVSMETAQAELLNHMSAAPKQSDGPAHAAPSSDAMLSRQLTPQH